MRFLELHPAAIAAVVLLTVTQSVLASEDGFGCSQSFDSVASFATHGWSIRNNSDPRGSGTWTQGNAALFSAFDGAANSFAMAGSDSASGQFPVVSVWLITPAIDFDPMTSARQLSFYTRAIAGHANRLEVLLCVEDGATSCAAPGPESGDSGGFQTSLIEINPSLTLNGYPSMWTNFASFDLPSTGRARIAFHYYVLAQDDGSYGTTIGIDALGLAGPTICPFADALLASGFDY